MLLFTKLRVSIQSPRLNIGEQVTYTKMADVAPAGISAFFIALLKSFCTLLARQVRFQVSVLVAYLSVRIFSFWWVTILITWLEMILLADILLEGQSYAYEESEYCYSRFSAVLTFSTWCGYQAWFDGSFGMYERL